MSLFEALSRSVKVASTGVSLGALAAAPALFQMGAQDVGRVAGLLVWVLVLAPSLVMLVLAMNDRVAGDTARYTGGARSYATQLAIGVGGAALAYAAFYTLAVAAPGVLGGVDSSAVQRAVEAATGWRMAWLTAAVSALGSLAVTSWVDRAVGE